MSDTQLLSQSPVSVQTVHEEWVPAGIHVHMYCRYPLIMLSLSLQPTGLQGILLANIFMCVFSCFPNTVIHVPYSASGSVDGVIGLFAEVSLIIIVQYTYSNMGVCNGINWLSLQ